MFGGLGGEGKSLTPAQKRSHASAHANALVSLAPYLARHQRDSLIVTLQQANIQEAETLPIGKERFGGQQYRDGWASLPAKHHARWIARATHLPYSEAQRIVSSGEIAWNIYKVLGMTAQHPPAGESRNAQPDEKSCDSEVAAWAEKHGGLREILSAVEEYTTFGTPIPVDLYYWNRMRVKRGLPVFNPGMQQNNRPMALMDAHTPFPAPAAAATDMADRSRSNRRPTVEADVTEEVPPTNLFSAPAPKSAAGPSTNTASNAARREIVEKNPVCTKTEVVDVDGGQMLLMHYDDGTVRHTMITGSIGDKSKKVGSPRAAAAEPVLSKSKSVGSEKNGPGDQRAEDHKKDPKSSTDEEVPAKKAVTTVKSADVEVGAEEKGEEAAIGETAADEDTQAATESAADNKGKKGKSTLADMAKKPKAPKKQAKAKSGPQKKSTEEGGVDDIPAGAATGMDVSFEQALGSAASSEKK